MTPILFRNANLIDPEGEVSAGDLWVAEGVIGRGKPPAKAREIDATGLYLAPGIVDLGVEVCEPGERHKESYRSAGLAAAAGGVTTIVTRPDTNQPHPVGGAMTGQCDAVS